MNNSFQQFTQQQQQQWREMGGYAAWKEQKRQKKIRKKRKEPDKLERQKSYGSSFAQLEQKAAILRRRIKNGNLTKNELGEKLKELMLQDSNGVWWALSPDNGLWYYYNDQRQWIQGSPQVLKRVKQTKDQSSGSFLDKASCILMIIFSPVAIFISGAVGYYFPSLLITDVFKVDPSIATLAGLWVAIICVICCINEIKKEVYNKWHGYSEDKG